MGKNAIGIIAEYNPFHNGHLYQLQQSRKISGCNNTVIVLSSHFVQRGEPAFLDKWTRTEMALKTGADLILELPCSYSCQNAGVFANAAIDLLEKTGIVKYVSFGMETPYVPINTISDILIQEPATFKFLLRSFLDKGSSFVEARARAIDRMLPGAGVFLAAPNNSLALSYVKRIREKGYDLDILPIRRISNSYHDENLNGEISSATSIRLAARLGNMDEACKAIPSCARETFIRNVTTGRAVLSNNILWRLLKTVLLRSKAEDLAKFAEVSEGVENLFKKKVLYSCNIEDFLNSCVSRRYPRSRIQRNLLHILLGLDQQENIFFQRRGPAYIRILGANANGREMIRQMRKTASLPVITRASAPYSHYSRLMMDFEHRTGMIWELLVDSPIQNHERESIPLMV